VLVTKPGTSAIIDGVMTSQELMGFVTGDTSWKVQPESATVIVVTSVLVMKKVLIGWRRSVVLAPEPSVRLKGLGTDRPCTQSIESRRRFKEYQRVLSELLVPLT